MNDLRTLQKQLKAYEEGDMELSDSASSTYSSSSSSLVRNGKDGTTTTTTTKGIFSSCTRRLSQSSNWEVEYVANIICHAELSVEDLVLGEGKAPIRQELFDRLEEFEKIGCDEDGGEEESVKKMGRKVLFDYVGEFVEEKCKLESLSCGSWKEWCKWRGLIKTKWVVGEELHKEMSGWVCVEEGIMVDEVVERDMSSGKERWVDFEREALEQGIEMEREIVSWLVDELVCDLLLLLLHLPRKKRRGFCLV